jgi:hypothetical protein
MFFSYIVNSRHLFTGMFMQIWASTQLEFVLPVTILNIKELLQLRI